MEYRSKFVRTQTIDIIYKQIYKSICFSIIVHCIFAPEIKTSTTKIHNIESRKEIAVQKKLSGAYNCTQSVCCTYHDFTGIDETTIKHVGNCFGAGMSNMEGTCGALVGAGMVYGLATKDKVKAMRGMRQMMEKFQKRNGATQCKLLKGAGTGKPLRECADCVADASEFLEELLANEGR